MKFKNALLGLALMLAVSCGSKEDKKEAATDAVATEAAEAPAEKDAAEAIVKAWMLADMDASAAEADVPEKNRAEFKKLVAEMVAKSKTKTVYAFEAGGKAKTTTMDYNGDWKDAEGTWALSEDKKMLTVTIDGKPDKMEITKLTDDSLELYSAEGKMALKFVPKK